MCSHAEKKNNTDRCKAEINFISYCNNPRKHIKKAQYIYKEGTVHIVSSLEKKRIGEKICIYVRMYMHTHTSGIRNLNKKYIYIYIYIHINIMFI